MRTGKTALPLDWPDLWNLYAAESNDELLDMLAKQVTRMSKVACFEDERAQYRAIHLALNRRLVTPPRLRIPIRGRKPDGKSFTTAEQALTIDKQVIDLDWLHCSGKRDAIPEKDLGSLFSSDAHIDWNMAEQLAQKPWRSDTKVIESLRLSDAEQFPLAILQSSKIRMRWTDLQKQQAKVETTLKNRADRYPTLSSAIPSLVAVWKADRMAADASLKTKAKLHQWIVGSTTPMASEQFREQLRKVRRHLEH